MVIVKSGWTFAVVGNGNRSTEKFSSAFPIFSDRFVKINLLNLSISGGKTP